MTQPHPQPHREYIITDSLLKHILICVEQVSCEDCEYFDDIYDCDVDVWEKKVCSRPHTPAAPATEPEDYLEKCKKGLGNCPPQCMTSSGCPNLNINSFDGDPETYPQDTFCKCPYRKKSHDAAIRKAEREKMLDAMREMLWAYENNSIWKWEVEHIVESLRGGA